MNADLLDADSINKAIAGSTYVVHTASPFYFPENDEDVIRPAVDGTMAVMNACSASGGVKRCVITSSVAAVIFPASADKPDADTEFYTEAHWTNCDRPEGVIGYAKSKTLAEQAAWDYQKSLPEDQKFEISTVNPCFVMGPTLIPGGFTSADMIVSYFNGSIKELSPENAYGYVDVRDVSKLHLEALRRPEAANQRFIAYSGSLYQPEVADIFSAEFSSKGYTIPTNVKEGERVKDALMCSKKA